LVSLFASTHVCLSGAWKWWRWVDELVVRIVVRRDQDKLGCRGKGRGLDDAQHDLEEDFLKKWN
jgi:hypothetical protein